MAAVLCAVICLTSITFMISSIQGLFANTSAELLGGQRVISAPEQISPNILSIVSKNSEQHTETLSFYSMLSNDTDLILSLIKAVESSYPLYGTLKISDSLNTIVRDTSTIPEPGTIWVEPRILMALNTKVGDSLMVGNAKLTISAVLRGEPDRVADGFGFVPRALMNVLDVARTEVVQPGSRINFKLLFNANESQLKNIDSILKPLLPITYEYRTANLQTTNYRNLDLASNYLWLAITINFILAAVAILISAHCYTNAHIKDAAIMRCLGASKHKLLALYVANLTMIAFVLGAIGGVCGLIIQQLVSVVLRKYIELQLPMPTATPFLFGVFGSLLLMLCVALPSILRLVSISPIQALRQESIFFNGNNWRIKFNFAQNMPLVLRLSLNNIFYNTKNNLLQLLAFALIISVALVLFNIRSDLLNNWFQQLPQDTPNYFVINIMQDDKKAFEQFLHNYALPSTEMYPIARGTLVKINQTPVTIDGVEEPNKRTGINRPLNLTWTNNLPLENKILQGNWFNQAESKALISIEKDMTDRLKVKLGDELTFMINMQEYPAIISSIRSVKWGTFTPNFYVIYSPGILDKAAHTYMVSFYLAPDQQGLLRHMVSKFPGVNVLSVTEMFDQANVMLKMLSLVIGFIWLFTLTIGLLLLLAIILSGIKTRNYQNNLMRILGASKSKLQIILGLEYLIIGACSGLLGSSIAIGAAKFVSNVYFQSKYTANWWTIVAGVCIGSFIMVLGGLIGTNKALGVTPMKFIRELNN